MTKVKLLDAEGRVDEASIKLSRDEPWHLIFRKDGSPERLYSAEDLFEALIVLRLDLEKLGYRLLCAGSRKDAYPSGMSRSMRGGRQVSLLKLGCSAETSIELLDGCSPEDFGTVEEQEAFYRSWIRSLPQPETVVPYIQEIEVAKNYPNGRVFRIAGTFAAYEAVPPEAIVGAWEVNDSGEISGEFVFNPNYDRIKWPSPKKH
ncbi:hypothetical protein [Rhizobium sp. AC27/96]|uniref:hypothetical protein n=1 Tax=Rhizobium sp. AC27/96 TaxID=1841653 RepID=UPI0018E97E05|nr:hypothetical protein [Rhizobium sp. AC27/96]